MERRKRFIRTVAGVAIGTSLLISGAVIAPSVAGAAGLGTVSATVTLGGAAVSGVCLTAQSKKSSFTTAPSDLTGVITQANVAAGTYSGFYTDCGGSGTGGVAVSFKVSGGKTTMLGTQSLPTGGSLYGQLLDATLAQGAPEVSMLAVDPTSGAAVGPVVCTDSSGNYALGGLPTTTGVKVEFVTGGCSNDGTYVPQWYGGTSLASASVVPIVAGCCGTSLSTLTLTGSTSTKATITSVAITGVSTLGGPSNPTITVTGTGFGGKPPKSQPVPSCPADPASGLGVDFLKAQLYLNDYSSQNWQAGFAPGDCVGLNIVSYSKTQIVFTFGSWYQAPGGGGQGPDGMALAIGDVYTMTVKSAHFTGIVP